MLQSELIEEQRAKFFPMELVTGGTVHAIKLEEMVGLIGRLWGDIMGSTNESRGHFQTPQERQSIEDRMRFHYVTTVHHELLLLKDKDGKELGWFIGEAEEHQTFYLRTAGILPGIRRQGFLREFVPKFLVYLRSLGYERVTSQHHPNNIPVLIGLLKNGFYIEGMNLDERYGPLVKTVCFLHEDRRQGFEQSFRLLSYGPPPAAPAAQAAPAAPSAPEAPAAPADPPPADKPAT